MGSCAIQRGDGARAEEVCRAADRVDYLGRFPREDGGTWSITPEAAALGGGGDPAMPLRHALEIDALTLEEADGPRLMADCGWARGVLDEAVVHDLAQAWLRAFTALVRHAKRPDAGSLTPPT